MELTSPLPLNALGCCGWYWRVLADGSRVLARLGTLFLIKFNSSKNTA